VASTERPDFELSAPVSRGSVGDQLRAARIAQGLTIETVAKQLKLAPRQVTALESDDVAALPDGPFVRGFVRNYARLVKINPDTLVHADENRRHALAPLQGISQPKGELRDGGAHVSSSRRWLIIPALLIGAVLAAGIWSEMRKRTLVEALPIPAAQIPVNPTPPPAQMPGIASAPVTVPGLPPVIVSPVPATPDPIPVATTPIVKAQPSTDGKMVALELKFGDASWTEIRDAAGNVLTSKLHPIGSSVVVSGQPPFRLTVGKASKVSLTRNGVSIDLASKADGGDLAKFSLE
jgi:cytoskeleton protein RodZ